MKIKLPFLIILFFTLVSFQLHAQWQRQWTWGGALDPLQSTFKVTHYALDLKIDLENGVLDGSATLSLQKLAEVEILRLQLIDTYEVIKVVADQREYAFKHDGEYLDIEMEGAFPDKITIYYKGKTPVASNPPWVGGFTWEKDDNGNHWVGLSAQNEGGKLFMPCLDHPSNKPENGAEIKITVPKPYTVASNGKLLDTSASETDTTFHWSTDYPIMNYNINFTIGKFFLHEQEFFSSSGEEVSLQVYVLGENQDKAALLASVLENSIKTHENYFGSYPFPEDKVAVVETPYLGMEHQTINGYGNNFQFVRMGEVWYDWLLHHELGHEWFGNKLSVGDWADFWIHEGITTYGDWLFYDHHGGIEAYHEKVADTKRNILNEKPVAGKIATPADKAYHIDVYYKGAYIMHSLRHLLGEEVFFRMLKELASHPPFIYENQANTEEVIRFIQGYTEYPLQGFFQWYLYETELPEVRIKKMGKRGYEVSLPNIDFSLPVEIVTERGNEKVDLSAKPKLIESSSEPKVDPQDWYLFSKRP
ncbi:M1 family metallopeptidase [Pleomorphovibrio marinus]|uniref:M1 family metallopeptidase n=1 Tax=Pleomorphovibrio marinus TaxID=2164132 RepID=UPI000E0BA3CE|nr:M1 family metallopeptidase [Pleomorphovibrio marinus]